MSWTGPTQQTYQDPVYNKAGQLTGYNTRVGSAGAVPTFQGINNPSAKKKGTTGPMLTPGTPQTGAPAPVAAPTPAAPAPAMPTFSKAPPPVPMPQAPAATNPNVPDLFSGQNTREAVNMQTAQIQQQANLPHILEGMMRPGMGIDSPYLAQRAMGSAIAPAAGQIAQAQAQIPFQYQQANKQNRMTWEVMADQQAMQRTAIQNQLNAANQGYSLAQANNLVSLLGQFL